MIFAMPVLILSGPVQNFMMCRRAVFGCWQRAHFEFARTGLLNYLAITTRKPCSSVSGCEPLSGKKLPPSERFSAHYVTSFAIILIFNFSAFRIRGIHAASTSAQPFYITMREVLRKNAFTGSPCLGAGE